MKGFGIDFGTTNTCAVELDGISSHQFGDEAGNPLPSIIAIDRDTGLAECGRSTWESRFELERDGRYHVIRSIKPFLGEDRHWATNTKAWSVERIAAQVLMSLSERVRQFGVAAGIQHATFSVPVNTTARQKRALADAARIAGITVQGFVSESTAALFRYFNEVRHMRQVAVFDWGGGTLDVSVLGLRAGAVRELAVSSLKSAGNAIDEEIARDLHRRIEESRGANEAFETMSPHDRNTLILEAERIKRRLKDRTQESMSAIYAGELATLDLSRESLRGVVAPFVTQALGLLERTIHEAGCAVEDIDEIIMVGGSSQLWALKEALSEDSRFPQHRIANAPDWDVAHGAAMLNARPGSYELAESVYLGLSDGTTIELLTSGSSVSHEPREINLVLVEDASQANLIFQRAVPGQPPRTCGYVSVPTLGFLQEDLRLRYEVEPELSLQMEAAGARCGQAKALEVADLRFLYRIEGVES